jgi:hypothetical protein
LTKATIITLLVLAALSDERVKLALLAADEDWLLSHLGDERFIDELIALALDVRFSHDIRERAARAACRLAAVNQQRISDWDEFTSPDD